MRVKAKVREGPPKPVQALPDWKPVIEDEFV
jgi:hypothetical protein